TRVEFRPAWASWRTSCVSFSPMRKSRSRRRVAAKTPATSSWTGAGSRRNSESSIPDCTPACSRSSTTSDGRKGFRRSRDDEKGEDMKEYNRISADCHLDMIWLPPDLFTSEAAAHLKDRMPYVADS